MPSISTPASLSPLLNPFDLIDITSENLSGLSLSESHTDAGLIVDKPESSSLEKRPSNKLHRFFTEETDIWLEIMAYAWVFDVLKLRRTCKHLEALTRQKVLWCRFLKRFCRMHGIPPATYDLDLLTPSDIEQAVLRPYRFERRLSVAEEPFSQQAARPFRSATLDLDTSFVVTDQNSQLSLDDVVETTALVRGGRYLIASHEGRWLCCWDLWCNVAPSSSPSPSSSESYDDSMEGSSVSDESDPFEDLPSLEQPTGGAKAAPIHPDHPTCPAIAVFHTEGKIARVLVQQSAEDENTLILAVYSQPSEQGAAPTDNLTILSLNLAPSRGRPASFRQLSSTRLNTSHRACWTLDGHYVLVAGLTGAVAIWNWRTDEWGFVKLSLNDRDDNGAAPEDMRAVRYPRVTMVGPSIFAVNFSTTHGLVCHFLKLPRFYKTLHEAATHSTYTQVARVHLSFNYLVGVFLPSWRSVSLTRKGNGLVQMLIWDDSVQECRGRYVSLRLKNHLPPPPPPALAPATHMHKRRRTSRRWARSFSVGDHHDYENDDLDYDLEQEDDEDEEEEEEEQHTTLAPPPPPPPTSLLPPSQNQYQDIALHLGSYVTLPRPGLFDESVSGHLACIGCSGEVAKSQIVDGPDGRGVRVAVTLGSCKGITEFSYMDCWSGVLGVAELEEGRLRLKTLMF